MWVDYAGLERLFYSLKVDALDGGVCVSPYARRAEALVHELAHAFSLGVPLSPCVSHEVARAVNTLSEAEMV